MASELLSIYRGRRVALLTLHGKQDLMRPLLQEALGCELVHTDGFDTDQLGSFTRDIARLDSQLETARKKAVMGMSLTGAQLGVASEGSFGGDPFGGFIPWNTELVLWVDQQRNHEVMGMAQGPAQSHQKWVQTWEELERFTIEAKFPEHHITLRPDHENHPLLFKGLHDLNSLKKAFMAAKAAASKQTVFVENDLRAFCNPTRQSIIKQATLDLVQKLKSHCPNCDKPGYWITKRVSGLACQACHQPTRLPVGEVWGCQACAHQETRALNTGQWADPSRCDACNP